MKHTTLDTQIRTRIDSFVHDLSNVVKIAALEAVHTALGAKLEDAGATLRAPARSNTKTPPLITKRAGKRGKRTSEDVLALANTVHQHIKGHEGQRLEEIGKGLAIATKELKLPIQKLLELKKIKTKGIKRGTKYFAR